MSLPESHETIAQLITQYGPRRIGPYATLRPHADFIRDLRTNRASFDTIVAILRERHGLTVSDTTLRKFCRDILQEPPTQRRRQRAANAPASSGIQSAQNISPRPTRKQRADRPQIAEVEFIDEPHHES